MIIVAVAFFLKLQTVTNAFVASLAVADLATSFFHLIGNGISTFSKEVWPLPQANWICEWSLL